MLDLTPEERIRLRNLNNDKMAIFALKKLFLNVVIKDIIAIDINIMAAQRATIEYIKDAFHELSILKGDEQPRTQNDNIV